MKRTRFYEESLFLLTTVSSSERATFNGVSGKGGGRRKGGSRPTMQCVARIDAGKNGGRGSIVQRKWNFHFIYLFIFFFFLDEARIVKSRFCVMKEAVE